MSKGELLETKKMSIKTKVQNQINAIKFSLDLCNTTVENLEEFIETEDIEYLRDPEGLQKMFVITKAHQVVRLMVVPFDEEPTYHVPTKGEMCLVVSYYN